MPMSRTLLSGLAVAVPPAADGYDTALMGAFKRTMALPPKVDNQWISELYEFTQEFIKSNFQKVTPDWDKWYSEVNQPLWRKLEYLKGHEDYLSNKMHLDLMASVYGTDKYKPDKEFERVIQCTRFTKKEFYEEVKTPRNIHPRSLTYMSIVGPAYHEISKQVFSLPQFIKKIPVAQRARYISKLCRDGGRCISTDYSSFECSFTRQIQETIEMQLYDYCLGSDKNMFNWCHAQCVESNIKGKHFDVAMDTCRMSGEMCTSLGNGFSNFMLMKFMAHKLNIHDMDGVVEGDDGLFVYTGPIIDPLYFHKLGFNIKLINTPLEEASFCGNVFDMRDGINVTEPLYTMASAGFSFSAVGAGKNNIKVLTAAKAMSMICEYPQCPIIHSLAKRMLRTTKWSIDQMRRHVLTYVNNSRNLSMWDRENITESIYAKLTAPPPPIRTRVLFEKLYGIPVYTQIVLEQELDAGIGWYASPLLDLLFEGKPQWVENYKNVQWAGPMVPYEVIERKVRVTKFEFFANNPSTDVHLEDFYENTYVP